MPDEETIAYVRGELEKVLNDSSELGRLEFTEENKSNISKAVAKAVCTLIPDIDFKDWLDVKCLSQEDKDARMAPTVTIKGSFKGKKFLIGANEGDALTQSDIGLSREQLRIKKLEQCRDEVKAVLEKYGAWFDVDCHSVQLVLRCSKNASARVDYEEL